MLCKRNYLFYNKLIVFLFSPKWLVITWASFQWRINQCATEDRVLVRLTRQDLFHWNKLVNGTVKVGFALWSILSVVVWQNDANSYFSVSLKPGALLHHGSVGRVQNKNTICFHLLFWHIFVFHHKIFILSFSFLFLLKYQISTTEY